MTYKVASTKMISTLHTHHKRSTETAQIHYTILSRSPLVKFASNFTVTIQVKTFYTQVMTRDIKMYANDVICGYVVLVLCLC